MVLRCVVCFVSCGRAVLYALWFRLVLCGAMLCCVGWYGAALDQRACVVVSGACCVVLFVLSCVVVCCVVSFGVVWCSGAP